MIKSITASQEQEKPDFTPYEVAMSDVYGGDSYDGGPIKLKNKVAFGITSQDSIEMQV